jgi:hypothetical protein
MIEVKLNLGIWGLSGLKGSKQINRALTRALAKAGSDAARALKTAANKRVRQRKRFKLARLRAAMPLYFPRNKKDINNLVWRMDVSGKPVPLAEFPYRQTKKGVSVAVNNGKRALVKGAFVARMKSGHVGIYRRRGKERLPIDEAFTTRVSDVFNDSGMIPDLKKRTNAVFRASFGRLLPIELGKVKP